MVETINQKIVKARKEHKCSWCHGIIKVGEEYENATCKSPDHGIYVWKNHMRCHELADGLDMWMYGWDGLNDDEFAECIQDYLYENNWFTGEDAHEDFQDWLDEQDWGSETLKAYEIFNNNKSDLQKYKEKAMKDPNFKKAYDELELNNKAEFNLKYPQEWPEEKGLTKSFIEKGRTSINIKDDKSLDDVERFIWADNDTDKI